MVGVDFGVHAGRSNQGAVLCRSRQRRNFDAYHGSRDAHGVESENHLEIRRDAAFAHPRLSGNYSNGPCCIGNGHSNARLATH